MNRKALPAALLLPVFLLSGCPKRNDSAVARVGKAVITEAEFRRKLSEVSPDYQNYVLTPHGRRQFLDVLIREKMILEAAKADGMALTSEFKERMDQLRKEEADRLAEARDYMLTRLWLERLRKDGELKVTDDEVQQYHKDHPTEISARHVLLATAEEAEEVLKRIRSGNASFKSAAQKESLDADTANQGGLMRPALMGEIIPELEVLFKMRLGEVGGPVRSKFGYHVLVKESERSIPFNDAEERIRNILEKQKLDKHLQSLQASYPVEVIDAQFR
jgi:parvulin-like peptidyl-prolyl isomerase